MAPVTAAERAALDGFFRGKRGARALIKASADALTTYFADKGDKRDAFARGMLGRVCLSTCPVT